MIVPCSKKPERKSRVYRSRVAEEIAHRKKLLNAYTNQQKACHASQQFNALSVYDNLNPYPKTHENALLLPVKNKVNNKKQSKKHLEPGNKPVYKPVTADNRRMTGKVNIYICSEANKSGQSKSQSYTNTSSDAITERSNSRCASASSTSLCKLINSIREKRKKLQQSPNFIHEKKDRNSDNSENNIICNDRTLSRICRNKLSESSKEQTGVKVTDDDAVCKDTISTGDSRCCEDENFSTDLRQKSSDSVVQCSSFNVYNNSRRPQSWTTIYPSKTRARLNDSDVSLSNALCINIERRNDRKNNNRSDVYGNNNKHVLCDAIDGSRWLPESIYTDCVTYAKVPKECFADSCKYRNGKPQASVLNRNNIWKRQIGYKLSQQPLESCQRKYVVRQWSTCSCIAEEEEDRCIEKKLPKNVCDDAKCPGKALVYQTVSKKLVESATACETLFGFASEKHLKKTQACKSVVEDHCTNVEKKLFENVCDDVKCPEKIYISRMSSCKLNENTTVCKTSLNGTVRKRFEETQTYKCTFEDSVECPRSATVCATTFGNSKEPPKVTRVREELVAEEPPRDIAVRRTMFGEPKGPAEEVTVCKAAPPDSKEAPEETICKKIPYSNFANQDNVKRVFLNDAKDKLVEENTSSSNLNNREENVRYAKGVVQPDNKYDNVTHNNFTGQKFDKDVKQEKEMKETVSNDQPKVPTTVESTRNPELLSKNIYSITLPRAEFYHRPNRNVKEIVKNLSDQQRMIKMQSSSNRQIRNYSQQTGKILRNPGMQDLASSKNDQLEEKTHEKLQDMSLSKNTYLIERKTRDSFLHRSLKKVIGVIRRDKALLKDRLKIEKTEPENLIIDDIERDNGKTKIVSKTQDKINDKKNQLEINEKLTTLTKSPFGKREQSRIAVSSVKPTAPGADIIDSEKHEKINISAMDQIIHSRPKLLRIIAKKKFYPPSTVIAANSKLQKSEIESVPAEIIVNEHVDQEEIPKEKECPQESIPTEITDKIKTEELVMTEISVSEIKDTPQDIVDNLKDVVDKKIVSKDIVDETTKVYVSYPQEKIKEEIQKSIPCKCDFYSDKCVKSYVTCPQKELEDESKILSYKYELFPDLPTNDCSHIITKCIRYNSTPENYLCKNNELKQKKDCCALTAQCTCTSAQYLKSCVKIDKLKFRDISSLKISSQIYTDCCGIKKECECKRIAFRCQSHEECKCKCCATRSTVCPQIVDKCKCKLSANCINCCRPRDRCYCSTSALACHIIKKGCSRKKAMICLYCDNPQDKCICRASIRKCTRSELPSDICKCRDCDREHISKRPDENQTIRVTSWKPRKEIRRYFARNFEDLWSDSIEECRCREKPKRQPPEELPYQRLNISDVMNELQRKMSESVCCTRCWKNPCCCGLRVDQDERKKEKRAEDYLRCPEIDKSSKRKSHKIKSPNNCRCISNPRDELTDIIQPIRRIDCVCKLSPCRCKKRRPLRDNKRRPLAKCYYCKSLPCTCITMR